MHSTDDSDSYDADEMERKEEEELQQTIAEMKRQSTDPMTHVEGETDVEDIYFVEKITTEEHVKKKPKKQGPTFRTHSQVEKVVIPDWIPSDDEEDMGFLKEEDDDGYEAMSFVVPKGGRKHTSMTTLILKQYKTLVSRKR